MTAFRATASVVPEPAKGSITVGRNWIDDALAIGAPRVSSDQAHQARPEPGLSCRRSYERGPLDTRFPGLGIECRCAAAKDDRNLGQQPTMAVDVGRHNL